MKAGFFRRLLSTIIDLMLVFGFIYLSFVAVGRSVLQDKIENYDEVNTRYSEIMDVYNSNLEQIQREYEAEIELAGEDQELKDLAFENYLSRSNVLNHQNLIDVAPYNLPLGIYFTNVIYYYVLIFLIVMSIYTIALKGATIGRRLLRLKLVGPVNYLSVFLHDIAFKYLLIIALMVINPLFSIMVLMFMGLVDTGLIAGTRNKNTIRDMVSKIQIEKIDYNY